MIRATAQGFYRSLNCLHRVPVSFPTIWAWMRAGTFPRSRIVGGKSMWLSTEIEAWLAALPLRHLKGDEVEVA